MIASSKKIAGIILAAGTSSRMGRTKQMLPYEGTTILGTVIKCALASDLDTVILVLGHEAAAIRDQLDEQLDLKKVEILINPHYRQGQSTAIVAGTNQLSNDFDAAMFLLGDQPLISKNLINLLVQKAGQNTGRIIIPYYKEQRGNPVTFDKTLFPELTSLKADTGARVLFKKHAADISRIEVDDPGILTDIDTLQDYNNLVQNH